MPSTDSNSPSEALSLCISVELPFHADSACRAGKIPHRDSELCIMIEQSWQQRQNTTSAPQACKAAGTNQEMPDPRIAHLKKGGSKGCGDPNILSKKSHFAKPHLTSGTMVEHSQLPQASLMYSDNTGNCGWGKLISEQFSSKKILQFHEYTGQRGIH